MKSSPLLSIGIIFKNEERCIERCLKSLEPLRQAVSCELIMADTGAEDASREIAERYADQVFDFPWISDFAAARNAVMDRCTGKWFLSMDCDEWLDASISELAAFVKSKRRDLADHGFVVVRNYKTPELEQSELYGDFNALRLVRMSTGSRFRGAIHEYLDYVEPAVRLTRTILHHDGYCLEDPQQNREKYKRNMELLRKELEKDPESLRVLMQCIESEMQGANRVQYIRQAMALIQSGKAVGIEFFAPVILAHAAENARLLEMTEQEEWVEFAFREFPNSIFVKIDVNYAAFMAAYDAKEWEKAIQYGEGYREGFAAYHCDSPSPEILIEAGAGIIRAASAASERIILVGLADAYLHCGQRETALQILSQLDFEKLEGKQLQNTVVALSQIHAQSMLDVSPLMVKLYGQPDKSTADQARQQARFDAFHTIAAAAFTESYREEETEQEGYWRPAYTAFLCLADRCEAGRAAAILQAETPEEMRRWLLEVEDWQALPIEALEYAIRAGVDFPLAEKPLSVEVLDGLATKLTYGENLTRQLALKPSGSLGDPFWELSLTLAAMYTFNWTLGKHNKPVSPFLCPAKPDKDTKPDKRPEDTPEVGLALIRRFAQVESAALPKLYAASMLTEANITLLPPMHRWGLYCARALELLDSGNPREYLAVLRRGLKACPGQKDMVQFLLDRFLEDTRPQTSPELLELAGKIREILAACSPDDPAAKAIRESDAYRQVAWLIEEPASTMLQ